MAQTEKREQVPSSDSGTYIYMHVRSTEEPVIPDDTYEKPRERHLSIRTPIENPYEVPSQIQISNSAKTNTAQKATPKDQRITCLLIIAVCVSLGLHVVNFALVFARFSTTTIIKEIVNQQKFELGTIMLHTSDVAPPPWLVCNGQNVSRTKYSALFALISVRFGLGDGHLTFNLPDLRGRFALGHDPSELRVDIAKNIGSSGGKAKHRLTVPQMPEHKHGVGGMKTQTAGDHVHLVFEAGPPRNTTEQLQGVIPSDLAQLVRTNNSKTIRLATLVSGNHTHILTGETANNGKSEDVPIVPPFLTLTYIIYPY